MLLCEAIGNPEPTIQWKLNGMPIDSKYKVLQASLGRGWIGPVCVVPLECIKPNALNDVLCGICLSIFSYLFN